MSDYNLTIIDVMTDGEHEDEFEIEGHHNHVMVYITLKKKLLNWVVPAKYEVVLDDFITDSKFRKIKTSPKIIEWYRAKISWYKSSKIPSSMTFFYKSKQEFFMLHEGYIVQEWEIIKAPENREDWGKTIGSDQITRNVEAERSDS